MGDFGARTRRGRTGFQPYCRPCMVAYHTEWRRTEEGGRKFAQREAESKARYPERERARHKLRRALDTGRITRGACVLASLECRGQIEGHHDDYSKPLDVRWACRKHHRHLDRERQAREMLAAGGAA